MWMIEERILVWRFNRGDAGALRRIYEEHRGGMMRVATALLEDRSFVEDVIHDVFVSFAETAGRFELSGSLKAYLSVCVANRARDFNRSKRRREAQPTSDGEWPSERADPEASAMRRELGAALDSVLARLPGEQREVVILHLEAGLPFRRIAALMEIPLNTAMSRYRYGLEKIRAAVNGSEGHA
ncbi:MAG: RNA polymerase sigma factor [Acidobacteriota bacterium]